MAGNEASSAASAKERAREVEAGGSAREQNLAVLAPFERVSEVVYGVLMAVSFTGSFSVADPQPDEPWTLTLAALGCNLAWGITDATMYLIEAATERQRRAALLRRLHACRTESEAHALLVEALPNAFAAVADRDTLESLRRGLLKLPMPARGLSTRDFLGALGVFLLVVVSTFPVALPLLLIREPQLALRISNLTALLMLFAGGYLLGRHAHSSPIRYGLALTAVGAALVAVIVALGG